MDFLSLAFNIIGRVPWERIILRQRDSVASMERMAGTLTPEKGTKSHLEPPRQATWDTRNAPLSEGNRAFSVCENTLFLFGSVLDHSHLDFRSRAPNCPSRQDTSLRFQHPLLPLEALTAG